MNNFETYKNTLSDKNKKLIDSDEFTFYAMDLIVFNDNEPEIEEIKKEFKRFKEMLLKQKIIDRLIKIQSSIVWFSSNYAINDLVTMYFFNMPVLRFTRYGKIIK